MTDIHDQAAEWLQRVNEPAFEDWEGWAAWMERDPRHAEIYWRLAARDADVAELAKAKPILARPPSTRRITSFAGLAAAALMALVLWGGWSLRPQPWIVETYGTTGRTLTLADGSEIQIDRDSRLVLDRRRARDVALEAGRAVFRVRHDAETPFRVNIGEASLTDLGTIFDVTRLHGEVRIGVAEGAVRVDQKNARLVLRPGEAARIGSGRIVRQAVAVEDVTSWTEGRLSFENERLGVVAQDLTRMTGRDITAAPSLENRRVSGSLGVTQEMDLRGRLEKLLDVVVVERGGGWELQPQGTE